MEMVAMPTKIMRIKIAKLMRILHRARTARVSVAGRETISPPIVRTEIVPENSGFDRTSIETTPRWVVLNKPTCSKVLAMVELQRTKTAVRLEVEAVVRLQ